MEHCDAATGVVAAAEVRIDEYTIATTFGGVWLLHASFHFARAVELKTNPIRPTIDVVYRAVRG